MHQWVTNALILNLCILRMFEDIFSLAVAQMKVAKLILSSKVSDVKWGDKGMLVDSAFCGILVCSLNLVVPCRLEMRYV